jgi:RHH-type proline utilization regulon transcriptional repressor/proline dehydrogenase/delta 1-pyrroline-5-carboxylate dehydrogenase
VSDTLQSLRQRIVDVRHASERVRVAALLSELQLDAKVQAQTGEQAIKLVERVRSQATPNLLEAFLAEYGLSTDEGIAMMCLAEALLRVPDSPTIDALIEDKIVPGRWGST